VFKAKAKDLQKNKAKTVVKTKDLGPQAPQPMPRPRNTQGQQHQGHSEAVSTDFTVT